MNHPEELDVVKIVRLDKPRRRVTGSESILRQPIIGDIGTVVHITEINPDEWSYTIECVSEDGRTYWLAEFINEEIEVLHRNG
jgi:hypothetical protein